MNYELIVAFIAMLTTSILFAFPKYFLAKIGYKGFTHPEDFNFDDLRLFYLIFGVLLIASWSWFIVSIPGVL